MINRRSIFTVSLVGILLVSAVGAAFAQTDDSSNPLPMAVCRVDRERGDNLNAFTSALGMSVVEIRAYLAEGGTLADLAAEKGLDLETLRTQIEADRLAELETCLNDAVTSGTITQAQADWVLETAQLAAARPELLGSCTPLAENFSLNDFVAEAVGMTVEEIRAYLQDGGNLPELLEEKGLDLDTLREEARTAMLGELETCLSEGVANGTITQVQADFLLEHAQNAEAIGVRGHFPGIGGGLPGMGDRNPDGRGGRGGNGPRGSNN
jgi:DNA-binding transcriptional MerR regulator